MDKWKTSRIHWSVVDSFADRLRGIEIEARALEKLASDLERRASRLSSSINELYCDMGDIATEARFPKDDE